MNASKPKKYQPNSADNYRRLSGEIFLILNESDGLRDTIQRVIASVKVHTQCDAVGLRLQSGEDFPYFVQEGFSADFLATENTLLAHDRQGGICRNPDGTACLECTCGLVILGQTDPANSLFTKGGSCWTNDSFPMLKLPVSEDPRLNPRNKCIHKGYASVALIPIRNRNRIVGLLQLNDHRPGVFTLEIIEMLEGIAAHIGTDLMRRQAEEALQRANEELERKVKARTLELQRAIEELQVSMAAHQAAMEDREKLEHQNQLLEKAQSLNRMAEAIAHHFNNQLLVVMLSLDMVAKILPRGEESESLAAAMQAAKNAKSICSSMLTYLGQSIGKHEKMDLSLFCRTFMPSLLASLPTNITVDNDFPLPGPLIISNAEQIKSIINNLFSNAVESLDGKSGTIRMRIRTVAHDHIPSLNRYPLNFQSAQSNYACFEMIDEGCGIGPDDREKLFDPFYTTKFTGRGMGLPATTGIVQLHHGVIVVDSAPGQGSVFRVYLPTETPGTSDSPDPRSVGRG